MTAEPDDAIEPIESEDEDLESATPVYRIRSYPSDPDLETLYGRWNRGEIEIPAFQRGFVWKPAQASKLIESFLMGLPIPGIFVFLDGEEEKHLVIDGQQRLTSIFGFFDGQLPNTNDFVLRDVDSKWEGKNFNTLDPVDKARLLHSILRVIIVEPSSRDDRSSIYPIFERLNTGGTNLTPQEIRNSTCHGPFNDMLVAVNGNPTWRKVFGAPAPDSRMRDIELIVRFLALWEESNSYTKPMKSFLNNYMGKHRKEPHPDRYQEIFLRSVTKVAERLGEKPFHLRRGINVATFDATMVAFTTNQSIPDDIVDRYQSLKTNAKFVEATTKGTTDVDSVKRRLDLAKTILFG